MGNVPVRLLVAVFREENTADEVLQELRSTQWVGLGGIRNAAVACRDQRSRFHAQEQSDWGSVFAGTLAAVVSALAAAARGPAAPRGGSKAGGPVLGPGSSAIVAVVEFSWVARLVARMERAGAQVLLVAIAGDVAAQVEAGYEVAFSALDTAGTRYPDRTAVGDGKVENGEVVVTDEYTGHEWLILTDKGLIYTTTPPEDVEVEATSWGETRPEA